MENNNLPELTSASQLPNIFGSPQIFDHSQRVAKALSTSDLVPKEYKGNISNTLIALDIASRIGASPLMVMQHLYIVHGKPSWSSTFLIAAINNCGRFNPLRYEMTGEGDSRGCVAWTTEKGSTDKLESPKIDMAMAKKEGWVQKTGSKWQTMPELMMRYRAAAFFSRLFAPEITMGMQSYEEVIDITPVQPKDNVHIENAKDELDLIKDKIIALIDTYPEPDKTDWKLKCVAATKEGKFDIEFAKKLATELNIEL
jgi:hypothetical protein